MQLFQIQRVVEDYYKLQINVKSRRRNLVDARKMYFLLCRQFTKCSLSVMGKSLKRDHATALYNIRSCKDLILTDKDFEFHYKILYNKVRNIGLLGYDVNIPIPKVVHPGRLLYGKEKSLRKLFKQRR